MKSDYRGVKRNLLFMSSSDIEEPDDILQVNIAASRDMLYSIGAYIFLEGARFPGTGQIGAPIGFIKETSQQMMWIGLELMGAHELSFDIDWSASPDSDFHGSWEQDDPDKGHWLLHLQNPNAFGGFTSVAVTSLDCGDDPTVDITDDILTLGIPRGCDGSDGTDGREVELRVDSGYIQWEYVTDDDWHNLITLAAITGAQGEQGEVGDTGATGATGEPGSDAACDNCPSPPDNGMDDGNATRCAVATACSETMYSLFTGALKFNSTQRTEVTSGAAGIGVIAGILFPGLAIAIGVGVAFAGLFNTLLNIEADGLIPYFDNDIKEEIRDQLYCILDITGDYTQDVHDAWKAKMLETSDSLHTYMGTVMDLATKAPFEWAASSAPLLASPDCSSAGCDIATISPNPSYPVACTLSQTHIAVGDSFDMTINFQSTSLYNGSWVSDIPMNIDITNVTGWTAAGQAWQWDSDTPIFNTAPTTSDHKDGTQSFGGNSQTEATVTFHRSA